MSPSSSDGRMDREDSDCEELADVGADLEAMFGFELGVDSEDGFNLKEVAEALNGGASRRELEDIIEAGLAERLEYRLCSPAGTPVPSGSATPDVEARMTPPGGLMTPATEGVGVQDGFVEEVAERLRPRRSSIAHPVIVEAVEAANSKRRLSLTRWVSQEPDSARARVSASKTAQRHRQSIIKAAEVLEAAGVSDCEAEASRGISVEQKLHFVQRAVEVAQRRHRQSVVRAVRAVTQVQEPESAVTDRFKIERMVAAAYAKQQSKGHMLGAPRALLHTQCQIPGKPTYFVHCGPTRPSKNPSRRRQHGRS